MTMETKTATGIAMDFETMRIEHRDKATALAVGAEMAERYFNPERISDMRDVREQVIRAAEHAAYEAIQRDRQNHLHDMAAIRAVLESRLTEEFLKPPTFVVLNPT